jgi:hypothetical protein
VVANTLNINSIRGIASLGITQLRLIMEFEKFRLEIVVDGRLVFLVGLVLQPYLLKRIKAAQLDGLECEKVREQLEVGGGLYFNLLDICLLTYHIQMCVLEGGGLRKEIMDETHRSVYTIHLGSTKMYKDLRRTYGWNNIKRDIAKNVE